MLKVTVAKNVGFCFGVKRAVKIVEKLLNSEKDVYITGDLIHNEEEMKRLEKMGLKVLDIQKEKWPDLSESTVVIRAHGIPKLVFRRLKKSSKKVVDATCPVVSKVAELMIKEEKKGFSLFLYGRDGHAEVEYLKSHVKNVKIVNTTGIAEELFPRKIALFSQTTMDVDGFKSVAFSFLKKLEDFSDFHLHETICSVTIEREREAKELARTNDVCVIVGGKKSSNTRKLYELAKEINKNSHMILDEEEVDERWFSNAESVGICSGTSTPLRTIQRVVKRIKNLRY